MNPDSLPRQPAAPWTSPRLVGDVLHTPSGNAYNLDANPGDTTISLEPLGTLRGALRLLDAAGAQAKERPTYTRFSERMARLSDDMSNYVTGAQTTNMRALAGDLRDLADDVDAAAGALDDFVVMSRRRAHLQRWKEAIEAAITKAENPPRPADWPADGTLMLMGPITGTFEASLQGTVSPMWLCRLVYTSPRNTFDTTSSWWTSPPSSWQVAPPPRDPKADPQPGDAFRRLNRDGDVALEYKVLGRALVGDVDTVAYGMSTSTHMATPNAIALEPFQRMITGLRAFPAAS